LRGLICILMAMTMLVSACGKQPKLPWQKSQPKFAVVDWQKLMKDHPKYKELIVSGESVENVMRMRDRQLQMGQATVKSFVQDEDLQSPRQAKVSAC